METKEKINFWKYVLLSVLWSLISLVALFFLIDIGLKLMSKASTFYFLIGLIIIAVSVISCFFVFDYHRFKILKVYKIKTNQEKELNKENKDNEPSEGNN